MRNALICAALLGASVAHAADAVSVTYTAEQAVGEWLLTFTVENISALPLFAFAIAVDDPHYLGKADQPVGWGQDGCSWDYRFCDAWVNFDSPVGPMAPPIAPGQSLTGYVARYSALPTSVDYLLEGSGNGRSQKLFGAAVPEPIDEVPEPAPWVLLIAALTFARLASGMRWRTMGAMHS